MAEKCFPLEHTEYNAQDVQLWFATRTSGVYAGTHLGVSATGSMAVTLKKGIAWLNYAEFGGCVYANTDDLVLTVPLSNGTQNRIDRVCIRIEILEQKCYAYIKTGTPARTPSPPALQRDNLAYEISVAQIYVSTGVTAINASNITDERLDNSVCGLMRDGVTGIDTSMLQEQLSESLKNLSEDLQNFREEEFDRFQEWIESLENILEGDVATSLALKVATLESRASMLESETEQLEKDKLEGTAKTVTLSASGWNGSSPCTQAVSVSGVTANNTVFVSPAPVSFLAYCENMVRATSQSGNRIIFTAENKPDTNLSVNVVIHTGVKS